jgi:uncharacterized protein YcnI
MRYRIIALASIAGLLACAVYLISNTHAPAQAPVALQSNVSAGGTQEAAPLNAPAGKDAEAARTRLAQQAAADFKSALVARYGSSILQR